MQFLILALVIGLFMHDHSPWSAAIPGAGDLAGAPWLWIPLLLGAKLLLLASYAMLCRTTLKSLDGSHAMRAIRRLDRFGALFRIAVLALYAADLALGSLITLRHGFGWLLRIENGNLILIDELLILTPTLATLIGGWWFYYPVDRAIRVGHQQGPASPQSPASPASTVANCDQVKEIWSRRQFIYAQLRHQVALMLVPLLMIFGWLEVVGIVMPALPSQVSDQAHLFIFAGAVVIFIITPAIISQIWDTEPLPDGTLRDRLLGLCNQYGVGVRQLLLWKTFGAMINAGVMGIIAPLRYILLTDGLIDQMPHERIEAVMAHEVAHVYKRHIFWLIVFAIGLLGVLQAFWELVLEGALYALRLGGISWLQVYEDLLVFGLSMVGTIICWALLFGWVSRRFERQADTFAVQHISRAQSRQPVELGQAPTGQKADLTGGQSTGESANQSANQSASQLASQLDGAIYPSVGTLDGTVALGGSGPQGIGAPGSRLDQADEISRAGDEAEAVGSERGEQTDPTKPIGPIGPIESNMLQTPISPSARRVLSPGQEGSLALDRQTHSDDALHISEASALIMHDALQQVAELNNIPRDPRGWAYFSMTWRHGSIAWRQKYLLDLVGRPINGLPIDRHVRLIKVASVGLLILSIWATWRLGP